MHYRLVSLWDLFVHKVATNKLMDGFQVLAKVAQEMQPKMHHPKFLGMPKPANGYDLLYRSIAELMEDTQRIGLDVAAANLEKAIRVLDEGYEKDPQMLPAHDARNFHRLIEFAQTAVRDQMHGRIVLALPISTAKYYEPDKPLFGVTVHEKFKQKGRREISEAGKCLALERYTACVFHLMRTLEVAIEALRV